MNRFNMRAQLPVLPPYRLDFTADALRRLAANVVDIVDSDGAYYRYLADGKRRSLVRAVQIDETTLEIQASEKNDDWVLPIVSRMLGTQADLQSWYRRSASIPWLAYLASELRGLKPPQYASLWEACAHAIVFQQISIHAAASIMRRLVERTGAPFDDFCIAFPQPHALLDAPLETLREAGLSQSKVVHLRAAAEAIESGALRDEEIAALPTPLASDRLVEVPGIGRWSAAVILLRGFGRLDIFPMKDSGVARTVKLLCGDPHVDLPSVLDTLGPTKGMLYYHLLLGRIRNLARPSSD
ncbi:MAG: hypothetical protein M3R51_08780 [Candidatus Eremiobacteraeota bacterium]|nr:hypothetical protein [Candidatus Eremiobacteraeota bacterium]